MANGEKEPNAQDIVDWISATLKLPWARTPTSTSSKGQTADWVAEAGPVGQILNSLGLRKFESIGFGVSDFLYDSWKTMAEAPDPQGGYVADLSGTPLSTPYGWSRGKAQRDLIEYWEDKLLEQNVPQERMIKFRTAQKQYRANPSVETYRAVQAQVEPALDYAISPSKLENAQAEAMNEIIPMLEAAPELGAKRAEDVKDSLKDSRSPAELRAAIEQAKVVIRTNVPGEYWTDKFKAEEAERTRPGRTYEPGDSSFAPSTRFTQQGIEELGGGTAFGTAYSNTGPLAQFTPQPEPDLVAEAIADLTGLDGWPVRLENGNLLIYRGTLPNGQPMLLGEFDWDEENSRLFKVGSGAAADPVAISTSVFEAADGSQQLINDATGEVIRNLGVGFNAYESGRDFREDQRQFDMTFGLQRDRLGLDRDRFGEDIRQFDLSFGEDQRQFNLGFGEGQRQFDTQEDRMERTLAASNYFNTLEELGRNYRTFVQTAPQLANAATQQGELVRQILTNGGDVLARTYFTRGGMSPLPEITQADLVNNLQEETFKIQRAEQQGIEAENRRRMRADMERARGEYAQFAELQRQTPQFTTRQIFDDTGFDAAQTKWRQSLADMQDEAAAARQAHSEHANSFQAVSQQAADAARAAGADATGVGLAVAAAQTQWQNQLDALAETVNQYDAQHQGPTRAQFTETIREQVPIPDFQTWASTQGPSFAPTPLLNVPNVPTPRRTTQEELIAQSRATTPPAVASVLSGQMPSPLQFGGLPLPTFQQLQALTPTEQQMLNTRLMTEFNVPLEDVAFQSQRQFSTPSMERNRDLARFRGYAV